MTTIRSSRGGVFASLLYTLAMIIVGCFIGMVITYQILMTIFINESHSNSKGGVIQLVSIANSPNQVIERMEDVNADGSIDMWEVMIRQDTEHKTNILFVDSDFDGKIDNLCIMPEYGFVSIAHDTSGDGQIDNEILHSRNRTNEPRFYSYQDINYDGRLDIMLEMENKEVVSRYILLNNSWVLSEGISKPTGTWEAHIIEEDHPHFKSECEFREKQWRLAI